MKISNRKHITKDGVIKRNPVVRPGTFVHICSICRHKYSGFGNNAYPINNGRCCDVCNAEVVVPARIKNYMHHGTTNN